MSNRNINPFTGKPITRGQGVDSIFGKNAFDNLQQKSVMDPGEPSPYDYVPTTRPSPVKRAATNESRPNAADSQQTPLRRSNAVRRKRADTSMDRDEMHRRNKKHKWMEEEPEEEPEDRDSHFVPANERRQVTEQDLSTRSPLDRLAQDPRHPLRPRAATDATPSAQTSRYSWMHSDEGMFQSPSQPTMKPGPSSSRPQPTTPTPGSYRAPQSATPEDHPRPVHDRSYTDAQQQQQRRAARLEAAMPSRAQLRQLDWAKHKLQSLPSEAAIKRKLEFAEARLYEPGSVKKRFDDDLAALRARSNARFKHF